MSGRKLAHWALAVIATSIPAAAMAAGASAGTANAAVAHKSVNARAANAARVHVSFDQRAATYVKSLEGVQYTYGGTSRGGFDCSGLTQYVYGRLGRHIARTAEDQFREFRPISKARAWGGDLVFFHVTSNPASYVYHVAIYEGGDSMVAASSGRGQVIWESLAWAGNTVTFGTITH
jgi:cell wall-associated NlpC family hydrolase